MKALPIVKFPKVLDKYVENSRTNDTNQYQLNQNFNSLVNAVTALEARVKELERSNGGI